MTQQNQIENIPFKKFQFKNGHRYRPNEINSATNSFSFSSQKKERKEFLVFFLRFRNDDVHTDEATQQGTVVIYFLLTCHALHLTAKTKKTRETAKSSFFFFQRQEATTRIHESIIVFHERLFFFSVLLPPQKKK